MDRALEAITANRAPGDDTGAGIAERPGWRSSSVESKDSVIELARWAEQNTWGGSLFLFPDAGRELYPGVFRGRSRRAVWVDWKGGMLAASLNRSRWSGSIAGRGRWKDGLRVSASNEC